jgi:hypothetical protein
VDWITFFRRARPTLKPRMVGPVLTLDPGETTGWAVWTHCRLVACGQEYTGSDPALMAEFVRGMDEAFGPLELIVFEEYRIRGNKARQHIGSEVVTIQHIGAIKVVASDLEIKLWQQSASEAKAFATDDKLKEWDLWQPNERHANDAIRHGCRYHLFVAGRKQRGQPS